HVVTYGYLPDGEVKATFTYTFADTKTNFPAESRGTHKYVDYVYSQPWYSVGVYKADGSVLALDPGRDCTATYGNAGCVEGTFSPLSTLIKNIKASAPPKKISAPGISLSTLASTPIGTYLYAALYPVSIVNDLSGNVIS